MDSEQTPVSLSQELYQLVLTIPAGCVASYGSLGRSLTRQVSGLVVGGWLRHAPEGVPWWRVVGAKGDLLVGKMGSHLALEQRDRLVAEGVSFRGEQVDMVRHFWQN